MSTPNLNIPDVTANEDQPEVRINQQTLFLEQAITEVISYGVTDSNAVTVTDEEFRRNVTFDFNDGSPVPTAQITVTVPVIQRGLFAVKNDTTQEILVTHTGQSDPAPTIPAGGLKILVTGGSNVRDSVGSGGGGSITVTRPNIGALVTKTDAVQPLLALTQAKVTFNNTEYDTGYLGTPLFINASDVFRVPAGVLKLRLHGGVRTDSVASVFLQFRKNNADFPGCAGLDTADTSGTEFVSITSPVIPVTTNDELQLDVLVDTAINVQNNTNFTYFSVEIVETDEDAFPVEQVGGFVPGTPNSNDLLGVKLSIRKFAMNDDFAGSLAWCAGAPSNDVVFDIQRDGVSIGSITFLGGSQVGTFATSGSGQEVFEVGERLTIHSPNSLFSINDVAAAFDAFLVS